MSKGMILVVRICGWTFLLLAVLGLAGRQNPVELADKAALYLSPFLAHFGMVSRFRIGPQGAPEGIGGRLGRLAKAVLGGLVGGYVLWNALFYSAVTLQGGRFDAAASRGTLLLALALGYVLATPPRPQPLLSPQSPSGS